MHCLLWHTAGQQSPVGVCEGSQQLVKESTDTILRDDLAKIVFDLPYGFRSSHGRRCRAFFRLYRSKGLSRGRAFRERRSFACRFMNCSICCNRQPFFFGDPPGSCGALAGQGAPRLCLQRGTIFTLSALSRATFGAAGGRTSWSSTVADISDVSNENPARLSAHHSVLCVCSAEFPRFAALHAV